MHPIQWKKKMSCCYYCTTSTHSEVAGVVLWRENGEGREKLSESKKGAGKVSDWLEEQGSNMKWLWLQSPPFPRILQYLIVISFPERRTPLRVYITWDIMKLKQDISITMYTYLQKYHVEVSSNTNINEMPQAHLLLTCTNNYLCTCILIPHHLFCLNSNHPQRTKIISPLLWCYLFRHTAGVPSWSLAFFHNIVFA